MQLTILAIGVQDVIRWTICCNERTLGQLRGDVTQLQFTSLSGPVIFHVSDSARRDSADTWLISRMYNALECGELSESVALVLVSCDSGAFSSTQ